MKRTLTHHGILGMKWGKRNGPPYPIEDYSKYSEDERKEMKTKAIREGNISEANANRVYYSDQELNAVKNRFELNKRVAELSKSQIKSGQQKANEIASRFETAARLTNGIANTAANSVKIYNTLGAVTAKLNGTEFQPINTGGGKKKKKDK